ncbi:hypothetical protein [Aureimonas sp. AU12]|uniref:hypothetical protein n=1 Tax=Aureimonas sp. AU12 TaxID=1638161 RepID=UPI0007812C63|nr:hypothetical protein [Aureimonas sp. AU12]
MTGISRRSILQGALNADAAGTMLVGLNGSAQAQDTSSSYVPYCGLAVMEQLSGWRSPIDDPFLPVFQT